MVRGPAAIHDPYCEVKAGDDRVYVRSAAALTRRLIGPRLERNGMVKQFAVGDHVRWNSEAGYVEGVIIKKHTHDVEYKGYVHHATESDPQYEIRATKLITSPCTREVR